MTTLSKNKLTPTKQQQALIDHDGNARVLASAGSGKTSLLKMYIESRPAKKSVLYLAFNRTVKDEAERKFRDIDHVFVEVRTAHSLAYAAIVVPNKYTVGFLNCEDIMKLYRFQDYVLATHVLKLINLYCMSKERDISDVDYLASITTEKAYKYAEEYYNEILAFAIASIDDMKKGNLPMIHDFYLKLYQLSNPVLDFDYILFDEGQDASETMLDIFLSQEKPIKIIVGDTHQQIYAWRGAVNSLEKVDYKIFDLTESFRFPQEIADMAVQCINWKKITKNKPDKFHITGSGKLDDKKSIKTVIGRTNIKLIDYVIENVILTKKYKKVYFEGEFKSYSISNVYMYVNDILALKTGQQSKVKNKRLKHLKDMAELTNFIQETEDGTLQQAVQMVEAYGKDLPEYLEKIKLAETTDKDEANIMITNTHKCKGMEYDHVVLLDDFKDRKTLQEWMDKSSAKYKDMMIESINEEINILYVALTRSKGKITIPGNIKKDLVN